MKDCFSSFHPMVNTLYFVLVLCFTMFFTHPLCLGISLICAFTYSLYLRGAKALRFSFVFMLPILLFTALLNPLFNHQGATILTYFGNGNPLTLESILYGIAAGVMLISVILWFTCYNEVMTSDKFLYLFGRIIPSLSLVLSMALRFVPRIMAQLKIVTNAQRCLGRDMSEGSLVKRFRLAATILSVMVTWALENAVETADSMKSRGYGLKDRTAFSIYSFDKRDMCTMLFLAACGLYVIIGAGLGGLYFRYFPTVKGVGSDVFSISLYVVYFALCFMPVVINLLEDTKWKSIQSKI